MKMKFISQRNIVLLCYSPNMAAANILYCCFLFQRSTRGKHGTMGRNSLRSNWMDLNRMCNVSEIHWLCVSRPAVELEEHWYTMKATHDVTGR